jgi:hypothetical protein
MEKEKTDQGSLHHLDCNIKLINATTPTIIRRGKYIAKTII